jgi:type II secretory pathway component PulC
MTTQVEDEPPAAVEPAATRRGLLVVAAVIVLVLLLIAAGAFALWLVNDRTRLQQQVLQQSIQMLELRERLTKVEVSLQEKSAALATRDAALAEANKPVVPVRVTFRLAFMGQGLVATVRNVSDGPLNVIAEVHEPGTEATRSISLALDANGTQELGYAQGWTITSGQSVTVGASGYRSVTAFAP